MIEAILPAVVAVEETFTDPPGVTLFPAEEAVIAKAVEGRRREFTTARACARAALARIGLPPTPIVPGARGAPQWPAGVVGSMTHCAGYRACAVARRQEIAAIGLDAEPHDKLSDAVLSSVASADEQHRLAALAALVPGRHWDRILFSAKESVYKAWFPLTRRRLTFKDASITIDPANGTFIAKLLVDAPQVNGAALTEFDGRWLVDGGFIATAVALPTAAVD
ncbi:4'-phosphopantetheinyl transferase family protein [Streptomyces sp. NPDC001393]